MRRIPYYIIAAIATLFCGCNPHLAAPHIATYDKYLFGDGFSVDSIQLDEEWWRMFGDTTLNRLVAQALARNKDIEIAASRIEEARHNLVVTRSTYWPSVTGERTAEGKY
jgi:multidrug efflux system outer membrane protein